jgi:DNA-directed RNA polymerase specialized sigma24 family protein
VPKGNSVSTSGSPIDPLYRIANLLALLLVKGESESAKILTLSAAGFSAAEIGALLGKQPNTVSVTLYQAKRPAARRKSAR